MSHWNSKASGHPRTSDGRIHVANHEYQVWRFSLDDRGEPFLNERNLLRAGERTDLERNFRARYISLLKKNVR